jgi:hypothetical protein
MNPFKSLVSWWRGPTDTETLAAEAEGHHVQENLQTIRHSQANVGKQAGGSLVAAPTPDVLDPGSAHRTD